MNQYLLARAASDPESFRTETASRLSHAGHEERARGVRGCLAGCTVEQALTAPWAWSGPVWESRLPLEQDAKERMDILWHVLREMSRPQRLALGW